MPFYDYKCNKCNHTFELQKYIKDRKVPETEPCPSCKNENCVEMIIGVPSPIDGTRLGNSTPSRGWREVLDKVKEAHPRHKIPNRW